MNKNLQITIDGIQSLKNWQNNWDGHGSDKPKSEAIDNACKWVAELFQEAYSLGIILRIPMVSADEEGSVICEWWYQDRGLSLEFSDKKVEYMEIKNADSKDCEIEIDDMHSDMIPKEIKWLCKRG